MNLEEERERVQRRLKHLMEQWEAWVDEIGEKWKAAGYDYNDLRRFGAHVTELSKVARNAGRIEGLAGIPPESSETDA